jgi:hypothetical protein
MNPLADTLGLRFPRLPPRNAFETVLEEGVQEKLRAWNLQGERVQPLTAAVMLAAAYAGVRDIRNVGQAELSTHIGKTQRHSRVKRVCPRSVLQPRLVHMRLNLILQRSAPVTERDERETTLVHGSHGPAAVIAQHCQDPFYCGKVSTPR